MALLALVLQLAVAAAHHHAALQQAGPGAVVTAHAMFRHDTGVPSDDHDGRPHAPCEVCLLLALSHAAIATTPPIASPLILWQVHDFDLAPVTTAFAAAHLERRARGPPAAKLI